MSLKSRGPPSDETLFLFPRLSFHGLEDFVVARFDLHLVNRGQPNAAAIWTFHILIGILVLKVYSCALGATETAEIGREWINSSRTHPTVEKLIAIS